MLLYFSYFFLYKFYCNKNTISIVSFNLSEKYYSPVNSTLITWVFFVLKKNNFFFKCTHENVLVLKSISKVD